MISATPDARDPGRVGAYGLGLVGTGLDPSTLVAVPPDWPRVELVRRNGTLVAPRTRLDGERAEFALGDDGQLLVERSAERAVFTTPRLLSGAELVHPYLAPVGAAFAWWSAREAFHAGGFGVDGGVWALLGDRGAGKSSFLAWLARAGFDVVCDDMLVVDQGRVFAGPRCVDLRPGAAEHLGVGELLAIGGTRERWRVPLGAVAAERPLMGWVFLEWGEAVGAVRLAGSETLVRLARNRSMMVESRRPEALLELAALPAWQLTRPRDWDALALVVERLLDLVVP